MGVDRSGGLVGSTGPEGAAVFPPSCDGEGFAACGLPTVLDLLSSQEWGRVRQAASRMHGAEALDASGRAVQECAAPALSGRREKRKKKQREFPAPRATAASGAGAQGGRRAWARVAAWALHLWHCFFGLVGSAGSTGAARAIHLWHYSFGFVGSAGSVGAARAFQAVGACYAEMTSFRKLVGSACSVGAARAFQAWLAKMTSFVDWSAARARLERHSSLALLFWF